MCVCSDKTVRLFRWQCGSGFEEDKKSPFLGHKYAVTKVGFSPKVNDFISSFTPVNTIFIFIYLHCLCSYAVALLVFFLVSVVITKGERIKTLDGCENSSTIKLDFYHDNYLFS